ncbi:MAG TPA: carboxypeptidase-like regulatory domain-containing protein [Bryobacteraceae bacterium]|nr:carboxypeptidase-like regulatory domain-containing protein [Bryobacteraceae bacterium]
MAALLMLGGAIQAQQSKEDKKLAASERIVEGTVFDPAGGTVNGAIVQLKDMRTLQIRSFITQQQGAYHFSGLKIDNDYELQAEFQGARSPWKRLSVFDTRKQPVINLTLEKKSDKPEGKS